VATRDDFADVLAANERYADGFALRGLTGRAAKGLAVLTCIDTRIEPLAMLGLVPGDAKILRNAGARVTDDVVRGLVMAAHLLDVRRVMVVAHTNCAAASGTDDDIRARISEARGPDTDGIDFLASPDQRATLRADVARFRGIPALSHVTVGTFVYDVDTGRVDPVD
jgi:carbonic anhydrase